jgi:hypothetical protein
MGIVESWWKSDANLVPLHFLNLGLGPWYKFLGSKKNLFDQISLDFGVALILASSVKPTLISVGR